MLNYIKILICVFTALLYSTASGQNSIPLDTSFTVYSAAAKVKKDYPHAEIVNPNKYPNVDSFRNIIYRELGERKLHLDLFVPPKKNKFAPGVILVHGGGWHSGNKSNLTPMALDLAAKGYVTAAVEYRLSAEALYPAAVIDLKNSIKWMKSNADKYNIDTNRIAILGCSAGAQLASLVGYSNGESKYESDDSIKDVTSDVHAVVNIDGLLDFTSPESKEFDTDENKPKSAHLWFGSSYKKNPDLWKEGSAYYHVDKNDIPIIFINSSLPHYHAGRDAMIEKLEVYKIYYEVHEIENTPHTFWFFYPWYPESLEYVEKFLDKIFGQNN